MAYITAYTLKTHKPSSKSISEILSQIQMSDYKEMLYAIDEHGQTSNSCTWYDHEDDLIKLSRLYPYVVFDLYGEGEESGDIWHKYFMNGKMQHCPAKITFDEFDVEMLRSPEEMI